MTRRAADQKPAKLSTSQNSGNVDNSSKKSSGVRGRPFVSGDPRIQRGNGPAKGAPNAGRPRDEWKAKLRELASRDLTLQHVDAVLAAGPDHPFYGKALDYVTDHGFGKAAASVDVTSGGEPLKIIVTRDD